jgi:excisionase family DNA binding protein
MEPQNSSTLTPAEFARQSGLSLGYVYSLLWSGRLQAAKSEGQWQIPTSALEQRKEAMAR